MTNNKYSWKKSNSDFAVISSNSSKFSKIGLRPAVNKKYKFIRTEAPGKEYEKVYISMNVPKLKYSGLDIGLFSDKRSACSNKNVKPCSSVRKHNSEFKLHSKFYSEKREIQQNVVKDRTTRLKSEIKQENSAKQASSSVQSDISSDLDFKPSCLIEEGLEKVENANTYIVKNSSKLSLKSPSADVQRKAEIRTQYKIRKVAKVGLNTSRSSKKTMRLSGSNNVGTTQRTTTRYKLRRLNCQFRNTKRKSERCAIFHNNVVKQNRFKWQREQLKEKRHCNPETVKIISKYKLRNVVHCDPFAGSKSGEQKSKIVSRYRLRILPNIGKAMPKTPCQQHNVCRRIISKYRLLNLKKSTGEHAKRVVSKYKLHNNIKTTKLHHRRVQRVKSKYKLDQRAGQPWYRWRRLPVQPRKSVAQEYAKKLVKRIKSVSSPWHFKGAHKLIRKDDCLFYVRFGYCTRGSQCPHAHDPTRVVICRRFLRGKCSNKFCRFSHVISDEKLPQCQFFAEGRCDIYECPYLHVTYAPGTAVCKKFQLGRCMQGKRCLKRHVYTNNLKKKTVKKKVVKSTTMEKKEEDDIFEMECTSCPIGECIHFIRLPTDSFAEENEKPKLIGERYMNITIQNDHCHKDETN
ncbi:Zinc finger CCCH domain-containing protein 3 [Trichinella pseudospiralis]|uniref:Zinc finger CCCH domain-containing protein 3 n=1 Tax=Trichinella pseudospiralis TaxID=6337 RepID=A0A0V1EBR6_TRIPS|nr:Zinc finger CCCH domain-containing protein 3 [Trichinella pseudospiralis]KRZ25478.1 Zinc finger CCCH domain-containing protein 3 [Trichinella pseudospiralis]KRZ30656.1 Zinc finger CCCH domain-containing protein 3 [Trichinella pseudospiralis]